MKEIKIVSTDLKHVKAMETRKYSDINTLVIHHSATTNATPESINRSHIANGWSMAGYNYLIRRDGTIYKLRPIKYVPSHCKNHNSNSIGICLEGNFEIDTLKEKQKDKLYMLIGYLTVKYKISNIYCHRDLNATACPGKHVTFETFRK